MKRIALSLALLLVALSAFAQEDEGGVWVDSTYVAPDGQVIRYQGYLKPGDLTGMDKAKALQDDRVPLGYGWKTLRSWAEGDLRPRPIIEETRAASEFFDLRFDDSIQPAVAVAFLEYGDYAYFRILETMDWVLKAPVPLVAAKDIDEYGTRWGKPWWIPGALSGDSIVVQPMAMLSGRGIAMESLTHLYVERTLRQKTEHRMPAWFVYGLGAYLAGEGWILKGQVDILAGKHEIEIDQETMIRDLEASLALDLPGPASSIEGGTEAERIAARIAYWRAYRLVQNIITGEGLSKVKMVVGVMEAVKALKFEAAVEDIYDKSLEQLVEEYDPWKE